jgi:transposase
VVVVINENDKVLYERRHANRAQEILEVFEPFRADLQGIAVESTFNWYWLVDALQANEYQVHLANTALMGEYGGLKYTDDAHDARWLAHLLRLGILPEGYIYPKAERGVRDLLRKRAQLVRQRTAQITSLQNLINRNTGLSISGNQIKQLSVLELYRLIPGRDEGLAAKTNLRIMQALDEQIRWLERIVTERVKPRSEIARLKGIAGVGQILAWTILLETGDIARFPAVGNYASYARCVESKRVSNGKKKGENNRKSGNKYLAWAFVEAANFAVRYHDRAKAFYQRKRAKTNGVVASKAVAHKLARATYHVLRDGVAFDITRAFA